MSKFALLAIVALLSVGCMAAPPRLSCPPCNASAPVCDGSRNKDHCPGSAPVLCEEGIMQGGCGSPSAASKWTDKMCKKCCDTSSCFDKPCPACSAHECATTFCPAKDPLICLEGQSKHGCGSNGTYPSWGCSKCCDRSQCPVTTTPKPTPAPTPVPTPPTPNPSTSKCPPCQKNSWVCNATTNPYQCPNSLPELCTSGTRKGECGTQGTVKFWHKCDSCCDTSACFTPCAPCTAQQCNVSDCGAGVQQLCLVNGGCGMNGDFPNWNCMNCCQLSSCASSHSGSN